MGDKVTQWPVDERGKWATWSIEGQDANREYVDDTLAALKAAVNRLEAQNIDALVITDGGLALGAGAGTAVGSWGSLPPGGYSRTGVAGGTYKPATEQTASSGLRAAAAELVEAVKAYPAMHGRTWPEWGDGTIRTSPLQEIDANIARAIDAVDAELRNTEGDLPPAMADKESAELESLRVQLNEMTRLADARMRVQDVYLSQLTKTRAQLAAQEQELAALRGLAEGAASFPWRRWAEENVPMLPETRQAYWNIAAGLDALTALDALRKGKTA